MTHDYHDLMVEIYELETKFGSIFHHELYEIQEKFEETILPNIRNPYQLKIIHPELSDLLTKKYQIPVEQAHTKKTVILNLDHFEALDCLICGINYIKNQLDTTKTPSVTFYTGMIDYLFYINRLIGKVSSSQPEVIQSHQSKAAHTKHESEYGKRREYVLSIVDLKSWRENKTAHEMKITAQFRRKFPDRSQDVSKDTIRSWITKHANSLRTSNEHFLEHDELDPFIPYQRK